MPKIDYSLILACYNEGPTFEKSLNKILGQIKKTKGNWEVIFVEDKSADHTKEIIENNLNLFPNAKAIFHKKNKGRGKSVSDGILASKGDICGFIDVDCEVSPRYIPLFIKEIKEGNDLVVAKRFYEGGFKAIARVIASDVYAFMIKTILKLNVDDSEAGYKFFKRKKILPVIKLVSDEHWFWDTEICARSQAAGLKLSQIPVLFARRPEKKSTVRLLPDTIKYIQSLIRFRREFTNG